MITMMKRTVFLGWLAAMLFVWLLQAVAVDAKFRDALNFEDNQFVGMYNLEVRHRLQAVEGVDPERWDRTQLEYDLSYGILQNYELGINVPIIFYEDGPDDIGDVGVIQRFKFTEKETSFVDSSGGLEFLLPTGNDGSNPPTGTEDLDFRLFGSIGNDFWYDWHWLAHAGYTLVGDDSVDDIFEYNTAVRYRMHQRIKATAEVNGRTGGLRDESEIYLSPGIIAQPRDGFSMHFSLPVGVSSDAADHKAFLELSYEF